MYLVSAAKALGVCRDKKPFLHIFPKTQKTQKLNPTMKLPWGLDPLPQHVDIMSQLSSLSF